MQKVYKNVFKKYNCESQKETTSKKNTLESGFII